MELSCVSSRPEGSSTSVGSGSVTAGVGSVEDETSGSSDGSADGSEVSVEFDTVEELASADGSGVSVGLPEVDGLFVFPSEPCPVELLQPPRDDKTISSTRTSAKHRFFIVPSSITHCFPTCHNSR